MLLLRIGIAVVDVGDVREGWDVGVQACWGGLDQRLEARGWRGRGGLPVLSSAFWHEARLLPWGKFGVGVRRS